MPHVQVLLVLLLPHILTANFKLTKGVFMKNSIRRQNTQKRILSMIVENLTEPPTILDNILGHVCPYTK